MTLLQDPGIAQPLATAVGTVENWYAAYTCERHEKKVVQQLEQRGIQSFLPLCRSYIEP